MDDAASPSETRPRDGESVAGGWGAAALLGGLVMIAAYYGFVWIPDRWIVTFLSSRVAAQTRDALVLLWDAAVFVVLSWVFVRLQRGRAR